MELSKHFEMWQWVNFMSFVAAAPEWQRSNGKSGMENAEIAPLYDVLLWASEKKSYQEAEDAYFERMKQKT